MLLAVALAATGLVTYNSGYTKSGYLAMAEFMNANLHADDGVVLAAPSQRFLADYYLDTENVETVPQTTLSSYWPQETATLVPHEVDGQIQSYLHEYPAIWLARYDEDSVDPGRFLPSYLTAVAYHDDCLEWKDVELCRFISPRLMQPRDLEIGEHLYAGEMALENAKLATDSQSIQGTPMLLVEFDWKATAPIQCGLQGIASAHGQVSEKRSPSVTISPSGLCCRHRCGAAGIRKMVTWRCRCRRLSPLGSTNYSLFCTIRRTCS